MAFTLTTDLTDFDLAESATAWSDGALDPDFFVQGSNSVGFYMAKNGRRSVTINPTDRPWSSGDHVYFWIASSVAAKMEPKTTGTATPSGVTLRVTLANGAYREWHVTGSDQWGGEWRCFVIDLEHTGSQLYASSGTFSTASNIASMTIYFDLSNSGNIRNVPANCWGDAIRIGTGLTAYNTSAADPSFNLTDIAAAAETVANAYGITETIDGVVFCQGRITVGDTATNHVDFDSQDEVLVFRNRDGSGKGIVADSLYQLNFVGNATGIDQDVNFGVKVGTGDTATGRSGSLILAGGSSVRWTMDWNDTDLHSFTMYGTTVQGAYNGPGVIGVQAGKPTTTHEVIGCTFNGCGEIDFQDAVCRSVNVLNSAEVDVTYGAVLWDEVDSNIKRSLFVNNLNAFEVRSLTADMAFDYMTFSGNTYDVRYEGVGNYNLNYTNGSAPSIFNAGTGTLTAVSTTTHTVIGLELNTKVTYVRTSDGVELYTEVATTSDGAGKYQTTYSYGSSVQGITVDLLIMHLDYKAYEPQIVMPTVNTVLPVVQVPDPVYLNP